MNSFREQDWPNTGFSPVFKQLLKVPLQIEDVTTYLTDGKRTPMHELRISKGLSLVFSNAWGPGWRANVKAFSLHRPVWPDVSGPRTEGRGKFYLDPRELAKATEKSLGPARQLAVDMGIFLKQMVEGYEVIPSLSFMTSGHPGLGDGQFLEMKFLAKQKGQNIAEVILGAGVGTGARVVDLLFWENGGPLRTMASELGLNQRLAAYYLFNTRH